MALNLKKAKTESKSDKEYKVLPEGRYKFVVEAGETGEFSTGTPNLEFTFRCESEDFKNRKMWHKFATTEAAHIYLIRFLEALGLEKLTEQESVSEQQIIKAAIGRPVTAYVEITTADNGKQYNNMKNFAAPEGGSEAAKSATASTPAPAVNGGGDAKKKLFS